MRIDVTQEDIANGVRLDHRCCPVARAIERATGMQASVDVDRGCNNPSAFVVIGSVAAVDLPHSVMWFVKKFDRGGQVEPFSFELDYAHQEGGVE